MYIRYSNNNIFVKFSEDFFIIQSCSKETAEKILQLYQDEDSQDKILSLLGYENDIKEIKESEKTIVESNNLFEGFKDNTNTFYISQNKLYKQNIPISIPLILAKEINTAIKNEDNATLSKLSNFWTWCSLIKHPESRESFFEFILKNDLIITDKGFVIAFRRAKFIGKKQDKKLIEFVTKIFLKRKRNKKRTSVKVFKDQNDNYFLDNQHVNQHSYIGELNTLYDMFKNKSSSYFESVTANNRGEKAKFYIGKETFLPDDEVDWDPNIECSSGLHVHMGNYNDLDFGDTQLVCIINPMNVAACPYKDKAKLRVSALTPIGILSEGESIQNFIDRITPETCNIIDQILIDQLNKIDKIVEHNFQEFSEGHTLIQEIPNINMLSLLSNIRTTILPSSVKERVIKIG